MGRKHARRWLLVTLACGAGIPLGIGSYTFQYAEGFSYFSTDPRACVNCHIMRPQFDAWQKSSHHAAAVCIDCHLPRSFVPKYVAKAENGFRHGQKFTSGVFDEPIVVQARGREILEENCVRCHAPLVAELRPHEAGENQGLSCVRCHFGVGHGETARTGGGWRPGEERNE